MPLLDLGQLGGCTFGVNFTQSTGAVTSVQVANASGYDQTVSFTAPSGAVFTQTCPAGKTITVNTPNGYATLTFDARGEAVSGVSARASRGKAG